MASVRSALGAQREATSEQTSARDIVKLSKLDLQFEELVHKVVFVLVGQMFDTKIKEWCQDMRQHGSSDHVMESPGAINDLLDTLEGSLKPQQENIFKDGFEAQTAFCAALTPGHTAMECTELLKRIKKRIIDKKDMLLREFNVEVPADFSEMIYKHLGRELEQELSSESLALVKKVAKTIKPHPDKPEDPIYLG